MHFKLSVDFAICTDCIKGWVEVKTRTISSKHNDKYMISSVSYTHIRAHETREDMVVPHMD